MELLLPDLLDLVLDYVFDLECQDMNDLQRYVGVHEWPIIEQYVLKCTSPHKVKVLFWLEACAGGNLAFCLGLEKHLFLNRRQVMLGLHNACINGRINVVKWIESKIKLIPEDKDFLDENYTLTYVCRNGHLPILVWIQQTFPTESFYEEFQEACRGGHLHIMKWISQNLDPHCYITDYIPNVVQIACAGGHVDICKWLEKQYHIEWSIQGRHHSFVNACYAGDLQVAQWVCEKIASHKSWAQKLRDMILDNLLDIKSCECGRLRVARWLCKTFGWYFTIHTFQSAFFYACINGQLRTAKWICQYFRYIPSTQICQIAFDRACEKGHFKVVVWLYKTFKVGPVGNSTNYLSVVCNNLYLCKWFVKTFPLAAELHTIDRLSIGVWENGNLETIEWVYQTFPGLARASNYNSILQFFRQVCIRGDLQILERLMEIYEINQRIQDVGFVDACNYGHLHIAQRLSQTVSSKFHICLAFQYVCQQGHLHVAKWMTETFPLTRDDVYPYLECLCKNVDLAMMQWMTSAFHFTAEDNPHPFEEFFHKACYAGRLQAVKWIAKQLPFEKIEHLKEGAFRIACTQGHLLVAQWLNKEFVIRRRVRENAFKFAKENGHLHVMDWLVKS